MAGGLPDIHEGALRALRVLQVLQTDRFAATLPASWGAGPGVLPALEELWVEMRVLGPLPPQWGAGGGFPRLHTLYVRDMSREPPLHSSDPPAAPVYLPDEWGAAGAFPRLAMLALRELGLLGPFPPALDRAGGFPHLTSL